MRTILYKSKCTVERGCHLQPYPLSSFLYFSYSDRESFDIYCMIKDHVKENDVSMSRALVNIHGYSWMPSETQLEIMKRCCIRVAMCLLLTVFWCFLRLQSFCKMQDANLSRSKELTNAAARRSGFFQQGWFRQSLRVRKLPMPKALWTRSSCVLIKGLQKLCLSSPGPNTNTECERSPFRWFFACYCCFMLFRRSWQIELGAMKVCLSEAGYRLGTFKSSLI